MTTSTFSRLSIIPLSQELVPYLTIPRLDPADLYHFQDWSSPWPFQEMIHFGTDPVRSTPGTDPVSDHFKNWSNYSLANPRIDPVVLGMLRDWSLIYHFENWSSPWPFQELIHSLTIPPCPLLYPLCPVLGHNVHYYVHSAKDCRSPILDQSKNWFSPMCPFVCPLLCPLCPVPDHNAMSTTVSTQPRTVDLQYSVRAGGGHNSYFKPAKLNGVVLASRAEVILQYCTLYFVKQPPYVKSWMHIFDQLFH